jgi:DNA-binding response OmpR family regulator
MMPDLDGNETTRRMRQLPRGSNLPIVFLTAKAMPGDREASFAAGASDYVTKPVDLSSLITVMSSWVSGTGRSGTGPFGTGTQPAGNGGKAVKPRSLGADRDVAG